MRRRQEAARSTACQSDEALTLVTAHDVNTAAFPGYHILLRPFGFRRFVYVHHDVLFRVPPLGATQPMNTISSWKGL